VQTLPQAPQWEASVWVLTQASPQRVWPDGQAGAQLPSLQIWPLGHANWHPPQWAASVWVSTQLVSEHITRPTGHWPMH